MWRVLVSFINSGKETSTFPFPARARGVIVFFPKPVELQDNNDLNSWYLRHDLVLYNAGLEQLRLCREWLRMRYLCPWLRVTNPNINPLSLVLFMAEDTDRGEKYEKTRTCSLNIVFLPMKAHTIPFKTRSSNRKVCNYETTLNYSTRGGVRKASYCI